MSEVEMRVPYWLRLNRTLPSRRSDIVWAVAILMAAFIVHVPSAPGVEESEQAVLARQAAEYGEETAKTIIDLQQFRRSESIAVEGSGTRRGRATLINLSPRINTWFLLTLDWGTPDGDLTYHLENPEPRDQTVNLSAADPHGIQITSGDHSMSCELWSDVAAGSL